MSPAWSPAMPRCAPPTDPPVPERHDLAQPDLHVPDPRPAGHPSQFPSRALPALAVALTLTFVARPIASGCASLPRLLEQRDHLRRLGRAARRGVDPAGHPADLIAHCRTGGRYFNGVFLMVIVSLLLQGWTIRPAGQVAGPDRAAADRPGRPRRAGAAGPRQPRAGGLSHRSTARWRRRAHPRWARPALIIRDGQVDIHLPGGCRAATRYTSSPRRSVRLCWTGCSPTRELAEDDRDFFGDFALQAEDVAAVAEIYGFALPEPHAKPRRPTVPAGPSAAGSRSETGCPGSVELIVRAVDRQNEVHQSGWRWSRPVHSPARARRPFPYRAICSACLKPPGAVSISACGSDASGSRPAGPNDRRHDRPGSGPKRRRHRPTIDQPATDRRSDGCYAIRKRCGLRLMIDWITGLMNTLGYAGIALLMFLENIFPPIPPRSSCRWRRASRPRRAACHWWG